MPDRRLRSHAEEVFAIAKKTADNVYARESEARDAKIARLRAQRLARDAATEPPLQNAVSGKRQP